jgi:replication factor C large subunit
MFNETYKPRRFKDIHGQNKPLKELIAWLNTWPGDHRSLLIHGPSGSGKTAAVYVVKSEMNYDLIELNTSDVRNAEAINKVVGNAARSSALFQGRKLILIDEADNIGGRSDMGGTKALAGILDDTENPIILIANDPYKLPDSIRRKVDTIRFNTLRPASIRNRLREIADAEGINVDDDTLEELASQAGGDMRAAINDLESLGDTIVSEDIARIKPRDSERSIFEGLTSVFKSKSTECRKTFYDVDKPPEEVMFWIDENMPKIYDPRDVPCAYNYLSRADVFLGRVQRRQYYRFWAYATDLMTAGVSICHRHHTSFQRYESPSYFKLMGRTKAKRKTLKEAWTKVGKKTHTSSYDARQYSTLILNACRDPEQGHALARYFELEPEEIEVLCPDNAKAIITLMKKEEESRKGQKKRSKPREEQDKETKRPAKKQQTKDDKDAQTSLFQF